MPEYEFRAIDPQGKLVSGLSFAPDPESLADILEGQGLFLMESSETLGAGLPGGAQAKPARRSLGKIKLPRLFGGRISLKELSFFTAQLSVMVRSALPILEALEMLAEQATNPTLKRMLKDIAKGISEGEPLSMAFGRYPRTFDGVYTSLLASGEAGGELDVMLARLSEYLNFRLKLKQNIRSALQYPLIVIFTAVCVIVFLMVFVLPTFMEVFSQFHVELPLPTRILIKSSNILRQTWYIGVGALIAFWIGFLIALKNQTYAKLWDTFKLKVPIVGSVVRNIALTRMLRTMASLLNSGVSILKTLELAKASAGNWVFHDLIEQVAIEVREGKPFSKAMSRSKDIPGVVIGMIATGERTGSLSEVIDRVASFYESETDAAIKNFFAAIEPLFIVGLGVMVGSIAVSVLLPMLELAQAIQ